MNITSAINKGNNIAFQTQEEIYKKLGIKSFQRKICFFIKENKNVYNIEGNNLVTSVGCLVTNISVYEIGKNECYNKTVYLCDVEFPRQYDMNAIKRDISKFIENATIIPLYAFANNHIISFKEKERKFYDIGLTMVDLAVSDNSSYGVLNFSNSTNAPMYKEVIYGNEYNPKYYNKLDAEVNSVENETRTGNINEIFDNKTKLICNKCGSDNVDVFINNVKQNTISIDKRTILINEFITNFFSKYVFIQFDEIEFVYNSTLASPLNIKKLTTFTKFESEAQDFYIEQLMYDIKTSIETLKTQLKEDFYMVFYINSQYVILDITLFKYPTEIRINKPLYKLYGEFALDSEEILNNIECSGDMAKSDMIETIHKDIKGLEFVRDISGAISAIDSATKSLGLLLESNKNDVRNLIEGNKCQRNLKDDHVRYLKSPND
jgi:hypothetical protein